MCVVKIVNLLTVSVRGPPPVGPCTIMIVFCIMLPGKFCVIQFIPVSSKLTSQYSSFQRFSHSFTDSQKKSTQNLKYGLTLYSFFGRSTTGLDFNSRVSTICYIIKSVFQTTPVTRPPDNNSTRTFMMTLHCYYSFYNLIFFSSSRPYCT